VIRIVLADDHTLVRAGIRQLIATARDMTVVGEAGDGHRAMRLLETTACDVLVLDLSLPVLSGTEVLTRAKATWPALAVLILSMYAEEQYARRLLAAGAAGYLAKDRSEDELLAAIRCVAEGRRYLPRALVDVAPTAAPHATLSAREHQIFTLLFQGRTVSEIAAELDLGGSTVSTHVARIKAKLGVRTVTEIVSYAHREGLVR
jgi:DNA-binding NarL/FixJ family response regulator